MSELLCKVVACTYELKLCAERIVNHFCVRFLDRKALVPLLVRQEQNEAAEEPLRSQNRLYRSESAVIGYRGATSGHRNVARCLTESAHPVKSQPYT